jgi:hypothetical protein
VLNYIILLIIHGKLPAVTNYKRLRIYIYKTLRIYKRLRIYKYGTIRVINDAVIIRILKIGVYIISEEAYI